MTCTYMYIIYNIRYQHRLFTRRSVYGGTFNMATEIVTNDNTLRRLIARLLLYALRLASCNTIP